MAASAASIFPSPGEFDMAIPEEWTLYKFRLERYLRSPAVKKLNNQSKIDIMLATMGKTADSTQQPHVSKTTSFGRSKIIPILGSDLICLKIESKKCPKVDGPKYGLVLVL